MTFFQVFENREPASTPVLLGLGVVGPAPVRRNF